MGRKISDNFIKDLENGVLSNLMTIIKDDKELIICFRDGYVNIYYKSHSIFKVEEQTKYKRYKFTFNIGHARYFDTLENIKIELNLLGIEAKKSKNKDRFEAIFYVKTSENSYVDFQTIINTYKKYEDDFFMPGQTKDLFTLKTTKKSSGLREKRHQQALFMIHQTLKNADHLLFYDMELSLPEPPKGSKEHESVVQEAGSHITGAPDCLAVRLENGEVSKIVLVEVKSTQQACIGDHGINKHDEDFNHIIKCSYYREFIVESMKETLKLYEKLGIFEKINIPEHIGKTQDDFEILYFFTHKDAIQWTEKAGEDNKDNMKKYKELYAKNPDMFVDYSENMRILLGKNYD